MYPGTLLANVGDLYHVGVQAGRRRRFAEGGLVHTGRAGADHDPRELVLADGFFDHILTGLGAHILIVSGKDNTGLGF